MNNFFAHQTSLWTLPGGLQANDEDDQRRLSAFLKMHPVIEQAIAARIAGAPFDPHAAANRELPGLSASAAASADISAGSQYADSAGLHRSPPLSPHADRNRLTLRPSMPSPPMPIQLLRENALSDPVRLPRKPMRLSDAKHQYVGYYVRTLKTQADRTSADKTRLLELLAEHLARVHPELGGDPWVHSIDSSHVRSFLEEQSARAGKRSNADGSPLDAAPRTLLKKLSDLSHFFDYLRRIAKATQETIGDDLAEAAEAWRQRAKDEGVHYRPFTDSHIRQIFEPVHYLAGNREPDYFWCPLLALFLGVRLGEVVNLKLAHIGHIEAIDVWYIDVVPDAAKNANSVRRLPVPDGLKALGFIDYVKHVRRLGAEYLFPHRDWSGSTARRDPSKNQSRRFGEHLDQLGISDPLLVFHSFRHTVVTALQDAGVPLGQAMQIVGHEAQSHAVKTGMISQPQARSVHLAVYTHADLERLGTQFPLLPLKAAL